MSGRRLTKRKRTIVEVKTLSGELKIPAVYGYDRTVNRWMNPIRMRLGLPQGKACSPELIERLSYTATRALSYEATKDIARMWGVEVSDSTIQHHVVEQGARIERRRKDEIGEALDPATRPAVIGQAKRRFKGQDFSLVIMLDGWMIRERGDEWGLKPVEAEAQRVDWREMKTGIVFRIEDQARTQSGRGLLLNKTFEAWRGDPREFGERLWALAVREGLYQARRVFVVADGAVWIWNLVAERFNMAVQVLDFYHASQHLWAVAHALHGEKTAAAKRWIEPLLHQLRHGQSHKVTQRLSRIMRKQKQLEPQALEVIAKNTAYFQKNQERLDYDTIAAAHCPIGSGAMESTCSQLQDRFKRTGQFWSRPGAHALMTLELIRRNGQWDKYWKKVA